MPKLAADRLQEVNLGLLVEPINQVANNPGRHEPGSGELNYSFILSELDRLGYDGWVSCEYSPQGDTLAGLAWALPYLEK